MTTYIAEIEGKWYAFAADKNFLQVYSIGSDCPKDGRCWVARCTKAGSTICGCPIPQPARGLSKSPGDMGGMTGNYISDTRYGK